MGRPKAQLVLRGQPILAYLLERWHWPGPTILVTAPAYTQPPGWEAFGSEVSDPVSCTGPLRGVLTALEAVKTELLVMTTCDMPGVGREQFQWLIDRLRNDADLLGVMTRRGGMIEPFPLALRAVSRDLIIARYASGLRSTYRLSELAQFAAVPAPRRWPDSTWMNLNAPEDLGRFEASP
jgi:molybdopterin-guanine dinucleotide biosynthesis protein A